MKNLESLLPLPARSSSIRFLPALACLVVATACGGSSKSNPSGADGGTDNETDNTDKLRAVADATENVALQPPTTPTRLLGRLRARSPFRRTVSTTVRRVSSSRLATSTATESRDGDDDADDDDDDDANHTPTKRARRDVVLTANVVKKNRGRLLAGSQKRFVRLAGATLAFAADEVTASFF